MTNTVQLLMCITISFCFQLYVQGQEPSTAAKCLKEKVDRGNYEAILNVADARDAASIEYLKQLASNASQKDNRNHPAFFAQVALAKFSDEIAIREILSEIDDDSPAIQDIGMYKLSLVGGRTAIQRFYDLLDDDRPRDDVECLRMFEKHNLMHPENNLVPYCDQLYFSRRTMSLYYLRKMVKGPDNAGLKGTNVEVDVWKKWLRDKKLVD